MLLVSSTTLVHGELFAPKRVDADKVAIAKKSYDKATLDAKKIYDAKVQKSKTKLDEKNKIAQKFWEEIIFNVAKNDKIILLNAKKIHDNYILKAKKMFDQENALAKNVFDNTLLEIKAKYSKEL